MLNMYRSICIFTYRAKDQHNRDVKKCIEEEISLNKENSYSKVVIESKGLYSSQKCVCFSYPMCRCFHNNHHLALL